MLCGLEVGAMLDGVHEHLAKGQANGVPLFHRKIRYLMNELNQSIGCPRVTASDQFYELWRGGKDFYAFIPDRARRSQKQHLFKGRYRIGLGEVAESAFAHGRNHVGGGALRGDDDEPYMRSNEANLAQKFHILFARRLFAGQDEIVGLGFEHLYCGFIVGRTRNFPGRKNLGHSRSDFGIRADHKCRFLGA